MSPLVQCVLFGLVFSPVIYSYEHYEEDLCYFVPNSLHTICDVKLNSNLFRTEVIVNQCHEPLDVTFTVEEDHRMWQYTFVSTNHKDSQIVSSLGNDNILLNVELSVLAHNQVYVYGKLSTSLGQVEIINSSTSVQENCRHLREESLHWTAAIVTLFLISMCAITTYILMNFCKQKQVTDELSLIDNMEAGASISKKARSTLKVKYQAAANKESLATIIENGFIKEKTPPLDMSASSQ